MKRSDRKKYLNFIPTSVARSLTSQLTYLILSSLRVKSLAILLTEGRWACTSLGLSILCCELLLSLYHSWPLVLPSPRDIFFWLRYRAVVSCSGGTTGNLLS